MANAGLFGGIGPNAYVNNLYAPQQQALAGQQAARVNTLNQLVQSILANLSQQRPDVAGAAAQDATSAANGAAATLQRLNPNASTQSMLQAIGAPQAQQAQVANQNANTFTGGAALDQYLGGALPAGVFAQDAAGRSAYLNTLPAIVGQSAIMGLGHLSQLASQENSQLASQKVQSLQQARTDLAKYVQTNQKNAYTQALDNAKLGQAQQKINNQSAQFKAKQTLNYQKFAQQTLQQNRLYTLDLQKLGVSKRSLQLRTAAQQLKLNNGGFTPVEVNRFKTDAAYIIGQAKTAQATPDYQSVMEEMLKRNVPISIAQAAIKSWNPTLQGTPITPSLTNLYNQMVGLGKNGKGLVGVGPQGQQVTLQANGKISKTAQVVLKDAAEYLGTPYAWGGESPTGFDCSGLAQYLYGKAGVQIPRTTYDQFQSGTPIGKGALRPGDLVFFKGSDPKNGLPGHVGIYVGGGKMIDAPQTGDVVRIQSINRSDYVGARRYG